MQLHTDNLYGKLGPVVRTCWDVLDLPQGQHAINHFPEHNVLSVEEVAFGCGYEELRVTR